jgi:hypothetical protein
MSVGGRAFSAGQSLLAPRLARIIKFEVLGRTGAIQGGAMSEREIYLNHAGTSWPKPQVCVFRPKPITHSGASRSPIPAEADHHFQRKPITDSS